MVRNIFQPNKNLMLNSGVLRKFPYSLLQHTCMPFAFIEKKKLTNMKESVIFPLLCLFLEIAYRFSIHTSKISKDSHPRTPVHTRLSSFKCIQCTPAFYSTTMILCKLQPQASFYSGMKASVGGIKALQGLKMGNPFL